MRHRTPEEVARRALVMGAVALRASLEVTDHPRSAELTARLTDCLTALELVHSVDPSEHDILNTPWGRLDEIQQKDAYWSGEAAALFCYMLGMAEKPPQLQMADHTTALRLLNVLHPEAAQLLMTPELRPENELLDFCKETRLTRVMLREAHVRSLAMEAAAQQQAIKIGRMKVATEMAECGIEISADEFPRIGNAISTWSPEQRQSVTGPYVARDVAVAWFLSDREYYFEAV